MAKSKTPMPAKMTKQKNLPGKAKKPQSPTFGMTKAPGKGSSSSKKSGGVC